MKIVLGCIFGILVSHLAYAEEDPLKTEALLNKPSTLAGEACANRPLEQALGLLDVVNLSLCANPQTREAWASAQLQAAQWGVSQAGKLPNVSGYASEERSWTEALSAADRRSIGVKLGWMLYDAGARDANIEIARQTLLAANASQGSVVQSVLLATVRAFYQIHNAQAALEATREAEKAAQESLAAAQARFEAGAAIAADKLQAQTALSQAMLNRVTAEGNLRNAEGALANLLGWEANRPIKLIAVTPPDGQNLQQFEKDVSALVEQAKLNRLDIQAAAAQLKAAESGVASAKATFKPSISLNSNMGHTGGKLGAGSAASVGVNLNLPLFTGYEKEYRIRAAEAQVEAKQASLERLRLQASLDVWTAYQNLQTATQSLSMCRDLVNSATQFERVAMGRYQNGVGTLLELLNAQSALANARQQSVQAAFNWNIGRATLAQAMGGLDEKLLSSLPK